MYVYASAMSKSDLLGNCTASTLLMAGRERTLTPSLQCLLLQSRTSEMPRELGGIHDIDAKRMGTGRRRSSTGARGGPRARWPRYADGRWAWRTRCRTASAARSTADAARQGIVSEYPRHQLE